MASPPVAALLLDLALILVLARLAGELARRVRQPPVLGEIVVGILAGPSLFHGAVARALFPLSVRPFLGSVADIGLTVFMFMVGMELDRRPNPKLGRLTLGLAAWSTLVPFGLGVLAAVYLAAREQPAHRLGFVLFLGVAVSVTAFPVLARIVTDWRLDRTMFGVVALSSAAVCDLAAWTMLAVVQGIVGGRPVWQVALFIPFAAGMLILVRPALSRLLARPRGEPGRRREGTTLAIVFAGLVASAAVTDLLGLNFVFGAFLFGLVMPRDGASALRAVILDRMEFANALLLPAYFIVTGLQVNVSGFAPSDAVAFALLLATAVLSKFGGVFLGARLHGVPARAAAVLASLANTRGLTELVVLGVGLQIGVIDQRLYSAMVLVAVVTTAMASPLLTVLMRTEPDARAAPRFLVDLGPAWGDSSGL